MGIVCRRDGTILTVALARPERANALDPATADALCAALDAAQTDPEVGAVILTGQGTRAFCAGVDLRDAEGADPAERRARRFGALTRSLDALLRFERPLIAAINGAAVGGGWMLAMLADHIVAAHHAHFALPEIDLGGPTPIGIALLESWAGRALAGDLVQTGRRVPAGEALRLGLVQRVVDGGVLPTAAQAAAELRAAKPARAYALNKRFLNRHRSAALAEAVAAARAAREERFAEPVPAA